MAQSKGIRWTNASVLKLAEGGNPFIAVQRKARDLVLRAKDAGWQGPPFNPMAIADLLGVPVEPSSNVADARTISTPTGLRIEFNPTLARERARFSIAHELGHILFPDVAKQTRHRGTSRGTGDDWQLEMLCNLAASEFVMPIGSLSVSEHVPSIEDLMIERRRFDVSAEAYLIRIAKTTKEPIAIAFASATRSESNPSNYKIEYVVHSGSAPKLQLEGKLVPRESILNSCTAIGYTDGALEAWMSGDRLKVECVGIPGFPGSRLPRIAALVRFDASKQDAHTVRYVHGNVLEPRGEGFKVICQLVNDKARLWGGGVARAMAKKFPQAQQDFSRWIMEIPKRERLGRVHFARANDSLVIASLVAQEGYGPSSVPRIRYFSLERCLDAVAQFAQSNTGSVHMPRIGAGQSGGQWDTVEQLVQSTLIDASVSVIVYDLPPRRHQAEFFD